MSTNFFSAMAGIDLAGNLQITFGKGTGDSYIVSVLLQNENCGDNAKQLIPPLILKGTAAELDDGFFENITAPVQQVSGLLVNMEAFLKQAEAAKKQSAMEKEQAEKEKKQQTEKDKKYRKQCRKPTSWKGRASTGKRGRSCPTPPTIPSAGKLFRNAGRNFPTGSQRQVFFKSKCYK